MCYAKPEDFLKFVHNPKDLGQSPIQSALFLKACG